MGCIRRKALRFSALLGACKAAIVERLARERLARNLDAYRDGRITFAELYAGVQGWINHVRYADTWGLREHVFATHPITGP